MSGWLNNPPEEIVVGDECWFTIPDFDQHIGPYFVTKHDTENRTITFDRELDQRINLNSTLTVWHRKPS